jgi:hypothetical protein
MNNKYNFKEINVTENCYDGQEVSYIFKNRYQNTVVFLVKTPCSFVGTY